MVWSENHFFRSGKNGPKSRQERALAQDARPDRFRHQDLVFPLVKIGLNSLSYFDNYMAVNYYSIKQIWKAVLIFMCSYLHFGHWRLIEM
jgi:hypothetical protein